MAYPVYWRVCGVVIGNADTERGALQHAARRIRKAKYERLTARLADRLIEHDNGDITWEKTWFVGTQLITSRAPR